MEDSIFIRILKEIVTPLLAVCVALIIGGVLMLIINIDPIFAYQQMWAGIAQGKYQIGISLVKATPLLLAGLGLGLAFRSGVFNIGAEGQIYIGALVGTFIGIQDFGVPPVVHVTLALLGGFIGGGFWGLIAGFLKAKFNVNEVITTILMNYIAILLVSFFTHGPLKDNPNAPASLPHTPEVLLSSRLPIIITGTRLHAGFLIAIGCAFLLWWLIFRTSFGFKARAVGLNAIAAKYSGYKVVSIVSTVMFISGGLAGMAGIVEILGVQRRLRDMFSSGLGFTAIAIALLGKNHPFGIILAAILFGGLQAGANNMQSAAGVPVTIVEIMQGSIIFMVAISAALRSDLIKNIVRWRRKSPSIEAGGLTHDD